MMAKFEGFQDYSQDYQGSLPQSQKERTILSLDSEEGIIEIGSPPNPLPGILDSISIDGKVLFESAEVQGRSGAVKIASGWEDAAVAIEMLLIDDTEKGKSRFDFLKEIAAIFKKVDGKGKPTIYVLQHPLINAWNVRQLLFSDLKSNEKRGKQRISVSLSFVEYEPMVAKTQERKAAGTPQKSSAAQTASPTAAFASGAPAVVDPPVSDKAQRGMGALQGKYGKY